MYTLNKILIFSLKFAKNIESTTLIGGFQLIKEKERLTNHSFGPTLGPPDLVSTPLPENTLQAFIAAYPKMHKCILQYATLHLWRHFTAYPKMHISPAPRKTWMVWGLNPGRSFKNWKILNMIGWKPKFLHWEKNCKHLSKQKIQPRNRLLGTILTLNYNNKYLFSP